MATDPAGAGVGVGVGVELQGIYEGVVADGLALVVEMIVYGAFSWFSFEASARCKQLTYISRLASAGFYACMVVFSTTIIA